MISEYDRDALRELMPDLLRERFGITNLRRLFPCPSPDHDDRDPSAHYYEDGNTVHCFGCGKTWDVFSLVEEADGVIGFAEQARAVAAIVGYRLDESPGGRPAPLNVRTVEVKPMFEQPKEAGAQDCSEACGKAFGNLYTPGFEIGRRYLRYRGLDDDDAAKWGLGITMSPQEIMHQFRLWEPEAEGFITMPFWNRDFSQAHYCMVRTISHGKVRNKEWRPAGVTSPLWNEWMLSASLPVVYVTEGLIDAMALSKITGKDVMALGGTANARRFASVLYHTPRDLRPHVVMVCMDEDDAGRDTAKRMCADLDKIGVRHNVLPPYPGGAKDADEWLMAGKGVDWDFDRMRVDLDGHPLYVTRWRDGS